MSSTPGCCSDSRRTGAQGASGVERAGTPARAARSSLCLPFPRRRHLGCWPSLLTRRTTAVSGRIRAGKVQLARSAHVVGKIRCNMLSIDSGAFVECHCKHTDEPIEITEPRIKPAPQARRDVAPILGPLGPPPAKRKHMA